MPAVPDGELVKTVGEVALAYRYLGPQFERILGPTSDYLGDSLKFWTEKGVENVGRIFKKAEKKLGPELERDGAVPPKVLNGILNDGQFCDDELGAEYLGGVLASSRTSNERDDRAATLVALVGRISTYQLRAHYVMYVGARRALVGDTSLNLAQQGERTAKALFLPFSHLGGLLDLSVEELRDGDAIMSHIVSGLVREELIEEQFVYGSGAHLLGTVGAGRYEFGHAGGLIYRITLLGVELFCAAHGVKGFPPREFLDPERDFTIESPIPLPPELGLVSALPPYVAPSTA